MQTIAFLRKDRVAYVAQNNDPYANLPKIMGTEDTLVIQDDWKDGLLAQGYTIESVKARPDGWLITKLEATTFTAHLVNEENEEE